MKASKRSQLHSEVVSQQRLYAQMLKDGLTSADMLNQVSERINYLNTQLYGRRSGFLIAKHHQ